MKVLTHEGVLLTLPFTSKNTPNGEFERIDGEGCAAVGVVTTIPDATVRGLIQRASRLDAAFATARQITNDIRFFNRALIDVADGAEIRMEQKGSKVALIVPPSARPTRQPVQVGDRIAINASVRPKAWMNCHGSVERIDGAKATIKLDEGDRQRVIRATGKDIAPTLQAPLAILDKLEDSQ